MMYTLADFEATLQEDQPNAGWSAQLKSLWFDAKGDWHKAHAQVDHLDDRDSAWVHAYLHRKEGDTANADYWYRRAGQHRPAGSFAAEWQQLAKHFIHG